MSLNYPIVSKRLGQIKHAVFTEKHAVFTEILQSFHTHMNPPCRRVICVSVCVQGEGKKRKKVWRY